MGYPDRAVQRAQEAVDLSEQLGHLYSLATAQGQLAGIYQYRNQPDLAGSWAEASRHLAIDQGFRYRQAIAEILRGWAIAQTGRPHDGVTQLRHGLQLHAATGASMETPYFLALLASALIAANQLDEAQETLTEALDTVRGNRSFFYEPELLRLKGSLLLHDGNRSRMDEAEECFEQSLAIARLRGARSLELRTATSICRLWLSQGRQNEVQRFLGPIWDQFTEGFDAPDLAEARAILDSVSGTAG
jgi:predicted ATPase